MMKKILFGMSALALLCACNEDFKDWAEPLTNAEVPAQTVNLSVSATSAATIDLDNVQGETIQIFTPTLSENATIESYNVKLVGAPVEEGGNNMEAKYPDYNITADAAGYVKVEDLQKATIEMFTLEAVERVFEATVSSTATIKGTTGEAGVIVSGTPFTLRVKPVTPAFDPYLWIPGNGNGWNHGVAPVLSGNNGVFTGYAYMNGEFKFTPVAGWDKEYNNGSFVSVSSDIDLGDKGGGNLNFTGAPGMYYLTVDIAAGTISTQRVEWSIIGSFNSWGGDEVMTYDTANHCLTVTYTFSADSEWKFRRDADWGVNLGGSLDALTQDGANLTATAGEHTIELFIEREALDGYHATIQ